MSAFDEWYDGMVGFYINSERINYDLYALDDGFPDPIVLRRWMKVCWNNALDAALNATADYDVYDQLFGLAAELEDLKENV